MRVAVIVVAVLVSTPSEASKSCMTSAEARQHFGGVHLYWHGPNRCWDATPTRRRGSREVQRTTTATRDAGRTADQPKWREAMSEMMVDKDPAPPVGASADARRYGSDNAVADNAVADSAVAGTRWIDRWTDIEPSPIAERWVDLPRVEQPPIIEGKGQRLVRPRGMVVVFVVLVLLALGTIEVLFRCTFYEWSPSGSTT
jgi:hypothetical protein